VYGRQTSTERLLTSRANARIRFLPGLSPGIRQFTFLQYHSAHDPNENILRNYLELVVLTLSNTDEVILEWSNENAETAPSKMQRWKKQDWKMWDQNARAEKSGIENAGSKLLGWKM